MALTNYGELKASVANWIHRTDLDDVIPDFISMARSRIAHDLKSPKIEKRAPLAFSSEYTNLPADVAAIRSIKMDGRILTFMTEDQIVAGGYDSATGEPTLYTIVGEEIRVIGTPASNTGEILYWYIPTAMAADVDTDPILTNYPQLYIYACMLEYLIYSENDERIPVAAKYYADTIEQVNAKTSSVRYPDGQLQVRAS